MPTVRRRETVAAGATTANVLTGNSYEFVGAAPAKIQVAIKEVTAAARQGVTADIQFGSDLLMQAGVPAYTANSSVTIPDDMVVEDVAAPGDRLVVRLQNPGAASATVDVMVRIEPLA